MEERIAEFKEHWDRYYSHIEMTFTDTEIEDFLINNPNTEMAVDQAVDRTLAQGLGDVQE